MYRLSAFIIIFCMAFMAKSQSPAMPDTVMERPVESIYSFPEQNTRLNFSHPDWKRMWINAGVLTGCYVAALFVLELLPEDATNWNRAEFHNVPLWPRWRDHVLIEGPEWDRDHPVFNYILHPYAGAAYFMAARSCGFNFWGSMLFSAAISTICWEFGVEAFMERPSYQDIFITPLVGAVMGEGFFRAKRYLVANDYRLFGSGVLGNIAAFLIDPVNEVVGLFGSNPARNAAKARRLEIRSMPMITSTSVALNVAVTF